MIIKTMCGRLYKLVGSWDSNMVFSSIEREDDEVMIYSAEELKELLKIGRIIVTENKDHYKQLN
jgi:hypothetical protein